MVRSLLDPSVRYTELKGIDPEDADYDAPMYEVELIGRRVVVAVGKPKYAFTDNSIVYFPAYLVNDDKVVLQIGVYEILEESLPNMTDEDGDLDLAKASKPLLYDFVDVSTLADASVSDDAELVADIDAAVQEDADESNSSYDASGSDNWVQRFMHNDSYGIKDNEGGGDCFFSTIRDGLATVGKTVTVAELRNRLSNAATPELYEQYKILHEATSSEVKAANDAVKSLTERAKKLKEKVAKVANRKDKAVLLQEATALRDELKLAKSDRDVAKQSYGEFKWMSKLTTFPKFVKALRTCSFWADDWATSVMERLYNIKVIIFSESSFEEGDIENVLQCGRGDDELLEKKMFRPTEYIMMVHTGDHYKLITYDGKGAFTYNELPRQVVNLVKQKCMERNAGIYAIIPEFNDGLELPEEVVEEPSNLQLHGEGTVFQFYDMAAAKPAPGKGAGELMGADVPKGEFKALTGDWRRKLSHGYDKTIQLDGHMWKTVEHYLEANKFAKGNPDFYVQFALDSGSELGQNVDMAKAAGAGKKYNGKQVRPKGVKVDDDWDEDRESEALEKALAEKFKDAQLAAILKATKDAKLMFYRKGRPARVEVEMMKIRQKL